MLKEVWDTPGRTMLRWVQQRLQDEWQSRDWLGLIYHKLVQGAADNALVAAAEKKDQHALRSLLQRDAWLASDTARANARHELRIMRREATHTRGAHARGAHAHVRVRVRVRVRSMGARSQEPLGKSHVRPAERGYRC